MDISVTSGSRICPRAYSLDANTNVQVDLGYNVAGAVIFEV